VIDSLPGGASAPAESIVEVVVEIPRGSRNKYEQGEDGTLWFDRRLGGPVGFPGDYGYVIGAEGEDGDALDALVLLEEATFPGVHMRCRVLGSFLLRIGDSHETKLLCVPHAGRRQEHVVDLEHLPDTFVQELGAFFEAYRMLEDQSVTVVERRGLAATLEVLRAAREAHAATHS